MLKSRKVISSFRRLAVECKALNRVLATKDLVRFMACSLRNSRQIMRTGKLHNVDIAMSRSLEICYHNRRFLLPLARIDAMLASHRDNATFGNIREMYANDCYLRCFHLSSPLNAVLDLGANRGLFSLIACVVLEARVVVGVEPSEFYTPVMHLLLNANGCTPGRVIRYNKFVGSSHHEQREPATTISINTIREQQNINRFGMVKVDIEGAEREIFAEPDWLQNVDNVTMELHHWADNLDMIPHALSQYGFRFISSDQFGNRCQFGDAMFLYASCTGALG
jgi:hypothetical protein